MPTCIDKHSVSAVYVLSMTHKCSKFVVLSMSAYLSGFPFIGPNRVLVSTSMLVKTPRIPELVSTFPIRKHEGNIRKKLNL